MVKIYLEERAGRIRGRREKRKVARNSRTRRQVLRYSFLFCLLFVGIAGFIKVSWSAVDPDTDVIVSGNHVVSAKQVRRILQPFMQKPIYSLNPKELEAKVQTLADVQHAFVRRYLFPRPHIDVEIMEEFPWASFSTGPDQPVSAVISQTGRLVPIDQFPGVDQPNLKIYGHSNSQFSESDVISWASWSNFIATQTKHPIDFVDIRKPADVQVRSGELLLRLGAIDSMMTKRLSRLPSVLPVIATLKKESVDYVDLSLDSNVPLKISKLTKKEELLRDQQEHAKSTAQAAETRAIAQQGSKPTM